MSKNKYLYDDINNVIGYEEITDFNPENGIDLSNIRNTNSREEYKKYKDYQDIFGKTEEKKEEAVEEEEKKIYDINSVLEKKRKLKENKYATLADTAQLNLEKAESLEKASGNDIDEKELTDLINTITSHNLLKDIKDAESSNDEKEDEADLLSDLLATHVDLNLEEGIASEYLAKEHEESEKEEKEIDNSFYTKSMDLSEQDFEFSDEIEAERKAKIKVIIIIVVILLLIVIGVVTFLFLKQKGIIK